MTEENNNELKNIRQELQHINQRLDGNDQRFEKIDQRFEKVDQRFEKVDAEFRVVHHSINRIAIDLYKNRLDSDFKHEELKAMFDTFMHRTNGIERLPILEKKVDAHGQRISKLEATRK
jgi:chromosome segregation ATPase